MNKNLFAFSTAAVAITLALSGCAGGSGSAGSSTPAMDHSSPAGAAPPAGSPASTADHNAADATFARMMIPHHAQAVQMSDMILRKQQIPAPVTALATRIKAAQGPEIETMTRWLTSWNEPVTMPSDHASGHASGHAMDGGMAGMMGEEDLKKLDAAQGTAAAKLFLTQMIAHHEGAVTMARTESSSGKYPDALQLSKDIASSQEAEIREMKELLAAL